MTLINKLTNDVIKKLVTEFKNDEHRQKINEEILHPLLYYISDYINRKLYLFVIFGSVMFIIMFIFVFITMIFVLKMNYRLK